MEIIQKLPEDLVKYITEFLPTNYEVNLDTYSYTYIHRDYPLIIKLTLNPYVYLKYRKTHSVKIIKPGRFRSVFVVMSFNVNYYDIEKLDLLPKNKVIMICNTWYINKHYKDMVIFLNRPATIRQKFMNGFLQMTLLSFIGTRILSDFNLYSFYYAYIRLFIVIQIARMYYEYIIIK
jgi:hypothetical protein